MSTLSVQMADLLPVTESHHLEMQITSTSGKWHLDIFGPDSGWPLWQQDCAELWQGLDAALAWIWLEYGTQEEAK